MYALMQCVAEAVVAKGVRGLAELVPGGAFLYDVANEAHRRLRDRKRADQIRAEVVSVAAAGVEEVRRAAEQVVKEVAGAAAPAEKAALELYLTQIPGAVRASFRRADDPSGKSVPDQFALHDGADLARRLPSRLPRFRPGDPLPGRPGWVVSEMLGSGGFGEVWLARNPSLAALKGAVKFGTDPQAREQLLRHEGGLVSRVMEEGRHPNIVPLLDAYLEGDTPWLMYEYVGGGELGTLIHAWQKLAPAARTARAVSALRTLAAAVGHFHRLSPPLVHRDLKPANILVSNTESKGAPQSALGVLHSALRIADFGIGGVAADAALAAETHRRSSGYLGSQLWGSHTPLYASPQQQRGEKPDPRDDVHALGVIGYQMLTGKLDTAPGADFARTLRGLNVPAPLIELLGDCAAAEPAYRPKDAAELADRLGKLDAPGAPPPAAEPPQVVGCPSCGVSLRFRAGATALRCVRCGTVFNPTVAAAPPPVVDARLTGRSSGENRRAEPAARDDRRDRDRDDDRRRRDRDDRDRPPPKRGGVHPGVVVGGAVFLVFMLVVLVFAVRSRGVSPPAVVVEQTPGGFQPPGFQPRIATVPQVPTIPGMPQGRPGGVFPVGPAGGPGVAFPPRVTPPPNIPAPAAAGPTPTVAQLRTFTSDPLAKDATVRYTPDGQSLLAVTPDGEVSVVSAADGKERLSFATGVKGFRPGVFPDGQALVTALEGKKGAYVVSVSAGVTKATPKLALFGEAKYGGDTPTGAAVGRNGEWIAVGGDAGSLMAWKVKGGSTPVIFKGEGGSFKAFPGPVTAVAFSDHVFPELLAACGETVREWSSFGDWRSEPRTLTAPGPVFSLAPFPNHRGVVAGVASRGVAYWDNGSTAGSGAFPADGKLAGFTRVSAARQHWEPYYAAMTGDGKFGFWDSVRTRPLEPAADQPPAADLDFHKDAKLCAVGHADGSVTIWHTGDRHPAERRDPPKLALRITDHGGPLVAVDWSADGKDLLTVDKTGRVRVWTDFKVEYPTGPPTEMKAP